jgi:hypothetical protein
MLRQVPRHATVLARPYDVRIRQRVQGLLTSIGVPIDERAVIRSGMPDDEAAQAIPRMRANIVIAPFHAHRDWTGQSVDGLGLLLRLAALRSAFPWQVVMPVSRVGAAAVMLRAQIELPATVKERVLILCEDELGLRAAKNRLVRHLAGARS